MIENYKVTFMSDPPEIVAKRAFKWGKLRENAEKIVQGTAPHPYMVMTFKTLKEAERAMTALYNYTYVRKLKPETLSKILDKENHRVIVWNGSTTKPPRIYPR